MLSSSNNDFYYKLKSTLLTALILVWCLFFARYITWDADVYAKNPEQELLMEVDLGNLDEAVSGNQMSMPAPAEPAPALDNKVEASPLDMSGEVKVNHPKAEAKPKLLKKSEPPKAISKKTAQKKLETKAVHKAVPTPPKPSAPVPINKIAPPPVPKAILSNKFVKSEVANSPKAVFSKGTASEGANGNQGSANGQDGAKKVFSNSGNSGISLAQNLRNRGIVQLPKFNEKFNENASFRVEIRVSKEGNCSFLRVMRTNSSSPNLLRIVRKKVTELRFKPSSQEDVGYIDFVFKVVQ